jgi:hypothetical protein
MPLPPSDIPRQPLHTRSIRVQGYRRDDDLLELDAELVDYKGYDFTRLDGQVVKAGDHIHHMHLRVTIDASYTIVAAQAAYDAAPYAEICTSIDSAYADLVGMNLLKNFRNQVKDRFGQAAGCTHMTELCLVLPTAAIQANAGMRRESVQKKPDQRPFQLGGCHALRTDGPVVQEHYPQWFTPSLSHTS